MLIPKFECKEGEAIALVGPSGCGKSTFLNLIAGILNPSAGDIYIDTTEITSLSRAGSSAFRLSEIGLIFQEFELVEHLSVGDNILLPSYLGTRKDHAATEGIAKDFARDFGILNHWNTLPGNLSHGERQRAAICRALGARPRLLLADEPTGNLDPANKHKTLELLHSSAKEHNQGLLVVTHDLELVHAFDAVIQFEEINQHGQK